MNESLPRSGLECQAPPSIEIPQEKTSITFVSWSLHPFCMYCFSNTHDSRCWWRRIENCASKIPSGASSHLLFEITPSQADSHGPTRSPLPLARLSPYLITYLTTFLLILYLLLCLTLLSLLTSNRDWQGTKRTAYILRLTLLDGHTAGLTEWWPFNSGGGCMLDNMWIENCMATWIW